MNCSMKSVKIRSFLLGQVRRIVQKLRTTKFKDLDEFEIWKILAVVDDLKAQT